MIIKTGIIPKTAISFLGINIYWYGVLIVFAIIIGIMVCKFKKQNFGIKFNDFFDLCLFLIPVSIIGARIYYVIFELEYFLNNKKELLNIKNGGLAIYGGVIFGIITVIIFCRIKKISILDLLDYIVPSVALGQSIGRIGNYINIESYGSETDLPIKMEVIENGSTKFVHPTFLYEVIITFLLFIFLSIRSKNRKFRGEITYLYIIVYSSARIVIESLRTDSLMLYNYKISLIMSVIFFVSFSFIFLYSIYKYRKNN